MSSGYDMNPLLADMHLGRAIMGQPLETIYPVGPDSMINAGNRLKVLASVRQVYDTVWCKPRETDSI